MNEEKTFFVGNNYIKNSTQLNVFKWSYLYFSLCKKIIYNTVENEMEENNILIICF